MHYCQPSDRHLSEQDKVLTPEIYERCERYAIEGFQHDNIEVFVQVLAY